MISSLHADQCNSEDRPRFVIFNVKTVNDGFESITYLEHKIWERNRFFKEL